MHCRRAARPPGAAAHRATRAGKSTAQNNLADTDEIWQQSLAEAIEAEADAIRDAAGAELLPDLSEASRACLRPGDG